MLMLNRIEKKLSDHIPRSINARLPEAAVLIPVTNSSEPAVIFTRRALHLSTHSGEVAFPGGKREQDDKDLEMTALRESHEEVNLPPQSVKILGRTGSVISRFGLEVTPYVGVIPEDICLKPNIEELDRIFHVPLEFFLTPGNLRIDQWEVDNKHYQMPSYRYDDYLIWGLTAIILAEFLNITLDANIPLDVPQLTESFSNSNIRFP